MITFRINGVEYNNILEATFTESMVDFTNEATFTIALDGKEVSPFILGESCLVFLDNTKVMTGFIYDVTASYSSSSHVLEYVVRDITSDFSDSDIDNISELSGSSSLKSIIETIISKLKTKISVKNEFGKLKNFDLDNDKIKPEYGDNSFDYVQGLARKRQVLLSTDGEGNIIIFRNSDQPINGRLQNSISDTNNNNIISATFSQRQTELFNKYVVRSQLNSSSGGDFTTKASSSNNKKMVDQDGDFVDPSIRIGRQRCIVAEESSIKADAIDRARWLHDFSKVESVNYAVTINDHSIDGNIFMSNRLINVVDDFARINTDMLIKSVTATWSVSGGSITALDLVDKDSFKVLSETEEEEANSSKDPTISGAIT